MALHTPFRGVVTRGTPVSLIAAVVVIGTIALAGCATTVRKPTPSATSDELSRCERVFAVLDNTVEAAGVRDGGATPVKGFPYLRVNRFLAGYRRDPMSPKATGWWVERMRRLDQEGRMIELANLPAAYVASLPAELRRSQSPIDRLNECSGKLARRNLGNAASRERLRIAAAVPDDYQTWQRILGLYPLTALAFFQGILTYQSDTRETFATPLEDLPVTGRLIVYEPRRSSTQPIGSRARDLERSRDNPLGVPIPEGSVLARLFAAYAPLLEVDESNGNDRIGAPVLSRQGAAYVNTSDPTTFVRITHTRYQGEPLLQLVYSFWFPARPKMGALDLLGGHLDALIWRVTLDADGEPLLYDTIHGCGCYQMFFPTSRVRLRPREPVFEEPALVPVRLGRRRAGERILIRVASRTHYVENVRYARSSNVQERRSYSVAQDNQLRSLVWPGNGRRSLYRPDGIVPGSERCERYLYWPMGVPEPGAMRQWGRHATAFVGRRHFDDPTLIERYFEPQPARRIHDTRIHVRGWRSPIGR
jgi:hypothetical protein